MTGTVSNYFSILRYLDQATPCTTGFHPSFDVLWVAGWVAQVRQPSLVLVSSWIGRCWSLKKFIEQWPDDEEFNGHIMEHEIKWTYEANIRSVFCNGMLKYPLVKVRHGRKYEAMISKRVRYGNLISSMNIPLPESQLVYQLDGWRDVWYQHANFGSILLMSLGHLHCLADPCQVIGYGNSVYTYWMVPGFLKHVVTKRIQIDLVAVGSSFSSSAAKLQMHILLAVCVGTLLLFFFWTKTSELQVLPCNGWVVSETASTYRTLRGVSRQSLCKANPVKKLVNWVWCDSWKSQVIVFCLLFSHYDKAQIVPNQIFVIDFGA